MNRRGVYNSAGLPGPGIYVVNHIRQRESGEHRVTGSADIGWFWAFALAGALWYWIVVGHC